MTKLFKQAQPETVNSNITLIVKPEQLKRLKRLLSTYQPRDIANVLGWRALFQLLPHMNSKFRKFKFEYDRQRHLITKEVPRYE